MDVSVLYLGRKSVFTLQLDSVEDMNWNNITKHINGSTTSYNSINFYKTKISYQTH